MCFQRIDDTYIKRGYIIVMKSTLIKGHELGMYLLIRELVQKYPNDMELGGLVRQVMSKEISKESELVKNNHV